MVICLALMPTVFCDTLWSGRLDDRDMVGSGTSGDIVISFGDILLVCSGIFLPVDPTCFF